MAELLTRKQLVDRAADLLRLADKMTEPTHLVCIKCDVLYDATEITRDRCFCDYESDAYFGRDE